MSESTDPAARLARLARIREIERGLTEPMPADVTDTDAWLGWCERKLGLGELLLKMMTESGNVEGQAAARSLIEGAQAMVAEAREDSTAADGPG